MSCKFMTSGNGFRGIKRCAADGRIPRAEDDRHIARKLAVELAPDQAAWFDQFAVAVGENDIRALIVLFILGLESKVLVADGHSGTGIGAQRPGPAKPCHTGASSPG